MQPETDRVNHIVSMCRDTTGVRHEVAPIKRSEFIGEAHKGTQYCDTEINCPAFLSGVPVEVAFDLMHVLSVCILETGRSLYRILEETRRMQHNTSNRDYASEHIRTFFERLLQRETHRGKIKHYRMTRLDSLTFELQVIPNYILMSPIEVIIDFANYPYGVFVDYPSGTRHDLFSYQINYK